MTAPPRSGDRVPVFIMSFNRPDYLQQVLESIAAQRPDPHGTAFDLHLFQDGAVNRYSGIRYADDDSIAQCVALCREILPTCEIHALTDNVGVAERFRSAQSFAFDDLSAEYAIFLEDDMVLDPRYFCTMTRVWEMLKDERAVGYFAAYGDHLLTAAEVERAAARPIRWIPLQHNWAFGLKGSHWRDMKPLMDAYYGIVAGVDYRRRSHHRIRKLFIEAGVPQASTSQDAATEVATILLAQIKINLQVPLARYIGRNGIHFDERLFAELGYDRAPVAVPEVDLVLEPLAQERIDFIKADYYGHMVNVNRAVVEERYGLRLVTRDEITMLYRMLLGRDPESEAVYRHAEGRMLYADLRNSIIASEEYREMN